MEANYLSADPNQGSQNNADPDPDLFRLCRHKKLNFDMNNIFCLGNMSKNKKHTYVGIKAILNGWKSGLFVNFWSISLLLDPDPDPGEQNQ
jgi:hypothetical protein